MRVLIVEDHPDVLDVLERFCSRCGHQVAAAESLQTGIDFLHTEPFDAIIADIDLPDGTGYTLIGEARRSGSKALGIALSDYDYPSGVDESKITGFDCYLRKPCSFAELGSLLEQPGGGGRDFGSSTEA